MAAGSLAFVVMSGCGEDVAKGDENSGAHEHDGGEYPDDAASHDAGSDHDGGHEDADVDVEPEPEAFSLRFAAVADGEEVGCESTLTGLGPDGTHSIGPSDLRFYVSNLQLLDEDGETLDVALDEDDFQYTAEEGQVSLIDLTGSSAGTCQGDAIGYAEGTARTHEAITGTVRVDLVRGISFDIGVPQPLMRAVIASNSTEDAPSPLREMYWSWASGYRHFVFNFTVDAGDDGEGEGYVHVGSRDCGAMGELALESKDACGLLNTAQVSLEGFDLKSDTVALDLARLLEGLEFITDVYDDAFEVIGQAPGVACHSGATQPDCPPVFESLGLDLETGAADAAANKAFGKL